MEVGIREAQTNLSKLIKAARKGQQVFLTNRKERVVELVPVKKRKGDSILPGYGMFKDQLKDYPPEEWAANKERDTKELLASLNEW